MITKMRQMPYFFCKKFIPKDFLRLAIWDILYDIIKLLKIKCNDQRRKGGYFYETTCTY